TSRTAASSPSRAAGPRRASVFAPRVGCRRRRAMSIERAPPRGSLASGARSLAASRCRGTLFIGAGPRAEHSPSLPPTLARCGRVDADRPRRAGPTGGTRVRPNRRSHAGAAHGGRQAIIDRRHADRLATVGATTKRGIGDGDRRGFLDVVVGLVVGHLGALVADALLGLLDQVVEAVGRGLQLLDREAARLGARALVADDEHL